MPHRLSDAAPVVPGVPGTATTASSSFSLSLKMASSPPAMSDVARALEVARESPDGASDPTVGKVLDHALAHLWAKVLARPDDYVMTRDEFSLFNYFQHRFVGDQTAVAARARFWDNLRA